MNQFTRITVIGTAAVMGLGLAGCGKDSSSDSKTNEEKLSGTIFITGSSTVEPISTVVGEMFRDKYGVTPTVEGPGTGDGFKKFCNDEADIADASRKIKDEEKAACAAKNIEFIEVKVALDALTVMTNEKNDAVTCLKFEDLYGLVGPESESVKQWADAAQLGATTALPAAELKIYAPGTESGTYDSFWELAIKSIAEKKVGKEAAEKQKLRPDYGGLASDNDIVSSIASFPSAFGWVGFAFAEKATGIKEIAIDGGKGCVKPEKATVTDGTYPLSRSLYFYVNKAKFQSNETLKKFVQFYVSDEVLNSAVDEAGYVDLPAADIAKSKAAVA